MSYREENGQVILTMSREDWQNLLITLGYAAEYRECYALLNRLNEGNPNYIPYQVSSPSPSPADSNSTRKENSQ